MLFQVNNYYENEADGGLADAVDDAVNTILSLQTLDRQQSETSETEELTVKQEIQPQVKHFFEILTYTNMFISSLNRWKSTKKTWSAQRK